MADDIAIGLLGEFEVALGMRPVALPGSRLRALLAVLALNVGRPVAEDRLADAVWTTRQPADRHRTLQLYASRLRRLLGTDRIDVRSGGCVLDLDRRAVDVYRFRAAVAQAERIAAPTGRRAALVEALSLVRGVPLAGSGSRWLEDTERPQLVDEVLAATEQRIDLDLTHGADAELVTELRGLVARHPLREPLWQRLMIALRDTGRPAEALACYEHARRLLADQLGVDPSVELRRLHGELLSGTERQVAAAQPPVPRLPVPPRQLPAVVSGFTGRAAELAWLDDALTAARSAGPTPVLITALHGVGGIGKTALAVRWAHQVAHRFPDGQLFVNLRGFGPSVPVAPGAALEALLRAIGTPPHAIPADVDGRSAELRNRLAGRKVLLLLDNARDAEQVRPLLPGAGCLALVTSRDQLRGLVAREGARRLALDQLSGPDARALLAECLGTSRVAAEPVAVDEVIRLCRGLPLALRVVAERLDRGPALSVAGLATQLRSGSDRLDILTDQGADGLRAVFSWSYRALPAVEAHVFRLLGLHPGPDIGLPAAATLVALPPVRTRRLLDRLVSLNLLGCRAPDRYQLHDLLRAYAAERLIEEPAADRRAAVRRLLDWYAHTALRASRCIDSVWDPELAPAPTTVRPLDFVDDEQSLRWFDLEHANLLAAIRHAALHGEPDAAVAIFHGMGQYQTLRSSWDSWGESAELALSAARQLGRPVSEAYVLCSMGVRLSELRRDREALPWFENALAVLGPDSAGPSVGAAYGNMAHAHMRLGDLDEAIRLLELAMRVDPNPMNAGALMNLGAASGMRGDVRKALRYSRRAVTASLSTGNRRKQATSLTNAAEAYLELGRYDEARAAAEQAIAISRRIRSPHIEGPALVILGRTRYATGDRGGACACHVRVLEIYADLGIEDPEILAHARGQLRALG